MGSPLTVELAEIRVTELETIGLNTSQPPSLYKHFVDDGFGVFRDKTHAKTYLEYVNSLSSGLVYTIEHPSQDGSIPFLDIFIHKDLSISFYRKPTHTDTFTHYSTAAPQNTKDSFIRSLTRRSYNICSPQNLDLELTHVKSVLLDNDYPLNHINLIMHRTKNSLSKPKIPRTKDNGNLSNISVPYYPALSKPLRQISDRHNISITFTSNRNLRNMLTKMKTQLPFVPENLITTAWRQLYRKTWQFLSIITRGLGLVPYTLIRSFPIPVETRTMKPPSFCRRVPT